MMYAVIISGGKQFRVSEEEIIKLEQLDSAVGDTISFDKVLMVGEGESVQIGAPYLTGAVVTAEVVAHGRAKKIKILKFKRRKHHMKRMGHRQNYTQVKISKIAS
jgi:large subunit ribosomal protein L21